MSELLTDRIAVVTGGASGIGRAIARSYAEHGADVVVADVQETPPDGGPPTQDLIEAETESAAAFVDCDVTDHDDIAVLAEVAAEFGGVDVLVNNAGTFLKEDFFGTDPEDHQRVMDVNASGSYYVSQALGEQMVDTGGGSIVNISSLNGLVGNGKSVSYNMSKGAVRLLTYALAHRLGPDGVRVNAIHPGAIETPMTDVVPESTMAEYVEEVPLRRRGVPEDIAGAAVFLASDLSAYVSGESLVVDGGYVATGGLTEE